MFLLCFSISLVKYHCSFISCCFPVLDALQQHGSLQLTVHVSFPCEVFPLILAFLTPGIQPLSLLSGLVSHLSFSGLHILNTIPPFLPLPLSFPGDIPRIVVQPLVGKQGSGASRGWTMIFLCSLLLWLWAGGARALMYCTGKALNPFKRHRSCRTEKLEI